jgi:hypothetical protein
MASPSAFELGGLYHWPVGSAFHLEDAVGVATNLPKRGGNVRAVAHEFAHLGIETGRIDRGQAMTRGKRVNFWRAHVVRAGLGTAA